MEQPEEGSLQPSDEEQIDTASSKSYKGSESTRGGRRQPCRRCVWRASNPRLGHTLCSHHRACCQDDYWNPMDCEPCKTQLDRLKTMDPQELALTKAHFQRMLSETQAQLEDFNKRPWEYKLPAKIYFGGAGGFIETPEDPRNNSEHTSTRSNENGHNSTHTEPEYDQYDRDDESVLLSLLSVAESQYGSSSPDDCTHSTCANPKRGGGDCEDQIHKGRGKFRTT